MTNKEKQTNKKIILNCFWVVAANIEPIELAGWKKERQFQSLVCFQQPDFIERDILFWLWTESQLGYMAIKSIDCLFGELTEDAKTIEET